MLERAHKGQPSIKTLVADLATEMIGLDTLESELERLLHLQAEDPFRKIEVEATLFGKEYTDNVVVPVEVAINKLVEAKKVQISERVQTISEIANALMQANDRLAYFEPRKAEEVAPMVGSGRVDGAP